MWFHFVGDVSCHPVLNSEKGKKEGAKSNKKGRQRLKFKITYAEPGAADVTMDVKSRPRDDGRYERFPSPYLLGLRTVPVEGGVLSATRSTVP